MSQQISAEEYLAMMTRRKGHNKYGVAEVPERTWRGRTYASKTEMRYAQWLWRLCDGGYLIEIVEQPAVRLGEDTQFRPDFLIVHKDGCYYVDVKGVETQEFRRVKHLWAKYGRLPLRVVRAKGDGFATAETIEGPR